MKSKVQFDYETPTLKRYFHHWQQNSNLFDGINLCLDTLSCSFYLGRAKKISIEVSSRRRSESVSLKMDNWQGRLWADGKEINLSGAAYSWLRRRIRPHMTSGTVYVRVFIHESEERND